MWLLKRIRVGKGRSGVTGTVRIMVLLRSQYFGKAICCLNGRDDNLELWQLRSSAQQKNELLMLRFGVVSPYTYEVHSLKWMWIGVRVSILIRSSLKDLWWFFCKCWSDLNETIRYTPRLWQSTGNALPSARHSWVRKWLLSPLWGKGQLTCSKMESVQEISPLKWCYDLVPGIACFNILDFNLEHTFRC